MSAWNHDESLERIKRRYDEIAGVEISDVTRPIDFDNISLLHPRRVHGAHLYADIPNFPSIVGEELDDDDARELLRRLHLQHREVSRLCEACFSGAKVHFQGARLHAVFYRPIGDDQEIALTSIAFAAATRRVIREACNSIFGGEPWNVTFGIDIGDSVATMNNIRGDRELLFLGTPANRAAKILGDGISVTEGVCDALSDDAPIAIGEEADGVISIDVDEDSLDELVEENDWPFDLEASTSRIREELEVWPLSRIGLSSAQGEIDKSTLGLANSKRLQAAVVFADVDGFTAYVDEVVDDDEAIVEAVRAFHVIRSEMRAVAVADGNALRIQYQGDRMQALVFLPVDDEAAIAQSVVEIGAGLNASIAHTLPTVIGDAALPVAIGAGLGTVYLSRLGEHGRRDVLCVGTPNEDAAAIQLALDGDQFGVTAQLHTEMPSDTRDHFTWCDTADCYVASGLDASVLARAASAPALIRSTNRPYHPGVAS